MKRASFILFKISTILGIVLAAVFAFYMPFSFVMGFSAKIHQMLAEAFDSGALNAPFAANMDGDSFAMFIQSMMVTCGFVCLFAVVLCVISAIIASRVRKEATRGLLIASIVFGAMSIDTMIVGGIFGLIALNKEQPKE